jgi:NADH-quinone oxidoreductase subunit N
VAPPLVPQWQVILAVLATLTMFVGNLLAIRQTNVKRMLAYSSIAHAGYMLIGIIAAGSEVGLGTGALLFYLGAYVFMNLGAFTVLMIVAHNTGTEELEGFRGLSQRSLGLSLIMMVFLLSLTGIPPTAGFVGKLYIFGAAISSGAWWWLGVVGIVNSAISLYYYMNIARLMFFFDGEGEKLQRPLQLTVVLWVCLVATVGLCLLPQPLLHAAAQASMLVIGR